MPDRRTLSPIGFAILTENDGEPAITETILVGEQHDDPDEGRWTLDGAEREITRLVRVRNDRDCETEMRHRVVALTPFR